jgi:L-ascorbate metabolism protein UlaG (beta-lactamase superfamily)
MTPVSRDGVSAPFVRIGWYGHAMFLVEDDQGTSVVIDPFDPGIGYAFPDLAASVVLVSHDHYDHANVGAVKGNPVVVREKGVTNAYGVEVEGLPAAHDARGGAERGPNIIYRWSMAGMSFAHLGDLGHPLTPELSSRLRDLDVLFIPVGGTFTIDDSTAARTVEELSPRIAVPMHYKTAALGFPIQGVEPFANRFSDVVTTGKGFVYLDRDSLPETTSIFLFDYIE